MALMLGKLVRFHQKL